MKRIPFYLIALAFVACGGETEESSSSETSKDDSENMVDDILDEMFDEDTESAVDFEVYSGVERYDNDAVAEFETYNFQGIFEFAFPEEPVWEFEGLEDQYGYDKHTLSEVYEGSVFEIIIDDYSNDEDKEITDMDVHIGHSSQYEFIGGDVLNDGDVTLPDGSSAKYATYTWELDESVYSEDLITVGLEKHIVYLRIFSRPKFETAAKINAYISAFKTL